MHRAYVAQRICNLDAKEVCYWTSDSYSHSTVAGGFGVKS